MDIRVTYIEGRRFAAETRGHKIVSDQPLSNGGQDQGMTPPEFLLAALGTCAAYYAVEYLNARSLPTEGLEIRVDADKATQPARLGSFLIWIDAPPLAAAHLAGLERAVKTCIVHNTLTHMPSITISVRAQQTVAV